MLAAGSNLCDGKGQYSVWIGVLGEVDAVRRVEELWPAIDAGTRRLVAVIGDLMIDRYLTGKVDRISPEAPVPVLVHDSDRAVAGSAANVAVNIVSLGCDVHLVGTLGCDLDGSDLKGILADAGYGQNGWWLIPIGPPLARPASSLAGHSGPHCRMR